MEIWEHEGQLFEVQSLYAGDHNAWCHELTSIETGGAALRVFVPDATPDEPFTSSSLDRVQVQLLGGTVPWPILTKLVALVTESVGLDSTEAGQRRIGASRGKYATGRACRVEACHSEDPFTGQTVEMPDTRQGDQPSGSVPPDPAEVHEARRPSVWYRVVATAGGMVMLVDGGLMVGNDVNLGWAVAAGGALVIAGYLVDDIRAQSRDRDCRRLTPK